MAASWGVNIFFYFTGKFDFFWVKTMGFACGFLKVASKELLDGASLFLWVGVAVSHIFCGMRLLVL